MVLFSCTKNVIPFCLSYFNRIIGLGGVALIVERMVETGLKRFGHVERRPVDFVVRRVDQVEGSQITRGRGTPRENIKKDLAINELDINVVYDTPSDFKYKQKTTFQIH
jgi:hypothetical protein